MPDDKVLFLSDIFPTGYMAAGNCNIEKGDTVGVWTGRPVRHEERLYAWR
jgi:threonine dehydrogenase-like Zn-dependent dehydrogenase